MAPYVERKVVPTRGNTDTWDYIRTYFAEGKSKKAIEDYFRDMSRFPDSLLFNVASPFAMERDYETLTIDFSKSPGPTYEDILWSMKLEMKWGMVIRGYDSSFSSRLDWSKKQFENLKRFEEDKHSEIDADVASDLSSISREENRDYGYRLRAIRELAQKRLEHESNETLFWLKENIKSVWGYCTHVWITPRKDKALLIERFTHICLQEVGSPRFWSLDYAQKLIERIDGVFARDKVNREMLMKTFAELREHILSNGEKAKIKASEIIKPYNQLIKDSLAKAEAK